MKIQIESTETLTLIGEVPVRLWEGVTESGVPCKVLVHAVCVRGDEDLSSFDRDLMELPEIEGTFVPLSDALKG